MKDIVTRPLRTGAQGSVAWVFTEFTDAFFVDLSDRQFGALVALLTLVLGWVQILIEDKTGKAVLRDAE